MSAIVIDQFFKQRPFLPFALLTADGRELAIRHLFQGGLAKLEKVVFYYHPEGSSFEVIDIHHIVSLRTL